MKPTLLINPGVGWAATSPMHYTVSMDNQYVHMGHKKENWYLKALEMGDEEHEGAFNMMWHGSSYMKRPNNHPFGEYLSRSNRFIENTSLDMLMVNPKSLDAYIEYYLGHWENIKTEYQGVCDFSNINFGLSREFLLGIAPKLQEHFKVKVLMEFRDPVRRYFSEVGSLLNRKREVVNAFQGDFIAARFCARKQHRKLFFWNLKQGRVPGHCDYVAGYLKYCDAFGKDNVYPVVMEDFWNPDKEKEELERISEFFEYEITKIHQNVYVPDMGSKAPHYDYLEDQWSSDVEDLTEEDVHVAGMYMGRFYKDWKKIFGEVPEAWGK